MTYERPGIASGTLTAALAASNVGTWEWRIEADQVVACATTASFFGIPAAAAAEGLPIESYFAALHTEDRDRTRRSIAAVRRSGGLFVAEYRVLPAPGDIRWVLARGRFERGPSGEIGRARGIVIDVSESRQDGAIEGGSFVAFETDEGSLVDRLTARAVEMHRLAQRLDAPRRDRLKPVFDLLLLALEKQLGPAPAEDAASRERHMH